MEISFWWLFPLITFPRVEGRRGAERHELVASFAEDIGVGVHNAVLLLPGQKWSKMAMDGGNDRHIIVLFFLARGGGRRRRKCMWWYLVLLLLRALGGTSGSS